jgi:pyruvate dehydrogenase (quinone)
VFSGSAGHRHGRRPVQCRDAVLSANRPALFEAYVDPNVAPIPPHISLEQSKNFLASLLKGDAQALGFMKQVAKDVVAGYMPSRNAK